MDLALPGRLRRRAGRRLRCRSRGVRSGPNVAPAARSGRDCGRRSLRRPAATAARNRRGCRAAHRRRAACRIPAHQYRAWAQCSSGAKLHEAVRSSFCAWRRPEAVALDFDESPRELPGCRPGDRTPCLAVQQLDRAFPLQREKGRKGAVHAGDHQSFGAGRGIATGPSSRPSAITRPPEVAADQDAPASRSRSRPAKPGSPPAKSRAGVPAAGPSRSGERSPPNGNRCRSRWPLRQHGCRSGA